MGSVQVRVHDGLPGARAADKRNYVLGLLDHVRFVVAKAMARTLDSDQRQRLAQLPAVLAALSTGEIDALGDKRPLNTWPPFSMVVG
jgi:hypothetical protein